MHCQNYIVEEMNVAVLSCLRVPDENAYVSSCNMSVAANVVNKSLDGALWLKNFGYGKFFYSCNHGRNSK